MRMTIWILAGLAALVTLFFAVIPADPVQKDIYKLPEGAAKGGLLAWSKENEPVYVGQRSGLRMAIEGRLKWLGIL